MELERTELSPLDIAFDKENPRDETQKQIEKEPNFKKLKEHINENGLFYPVAVKREKTDGKEYVLIDGERRLRACQSLKLNKIPVILVKGDFDKRILAYQIHMLEKPWDMKVRVKSINLIASELKKDKKTEDEILKIIEELTKMPREQIRDILKILRYPEKVIKSIEKKESKRTYLIESENVFIPLIKKEFPKLLEKYDEEKIRKVIGNKLLKDKLNLTRSFRDLREFVEKDCKNKKQAQNRMEIFLKNPEMEVNYIKEGIKEDNDEKGKEILNLFSKNKSEKCVSTKSPREKDKQKEKKIIDEGIFELIFTSLKEALKKFEEVQNVKIENEKELQNCLHLILKSIFARVDYEDPTEKIGLKSNRLDFVLKDHNIIIETKYVRDKKHAKLVEDELSKDYNKYKLSPYGKKIYNYIYDPHSFISDRVNLIKALREMLPLADSYIE